MDQRGNHLQLACVRQRVNGRRVNGRRAFTLLELLMVVGVMLAIGALAFPLYSPMLDRQEFDSAVESALAQCEQARATAQERGIAIELVITDCGSRLEARPVDMLADAEDDFDATQRVGGDGMESALQGSAAARALGAKMQHKIEQISPGARRGNERDLPELTESWATLDMSVGVTASVEAPPEQDERAEFNGGTDGRVALFLPDGTATATRGCWLMAGGRAVRLDVNPLLGHAVRHEMAPKSNGLSGRSSKRSRAGEIDETTENNENNESSETEARNGA